MLLARGSPSRLAQFKTCSASKIPCFRSIVVPFPITNALFVVSEATTYHRFVWKFRRRFEFPLFSEYQRSRQHFWHYPSLTKGVKLHCHEWLSREVLVDFLKVGNNVLFRFPMLLPCANAQRTLSQLYDWGMDLYHTLDSWHIPW